MNASVKIAEKNSLEYISNQENILTVTKTIANTEVSKTNTPETEHKIRIVRVTTVPLSLDKLLNGQLNFVNNHFEVIAVSSDEEYLKKIGEKEKIKVKNIEMSRKITPFKDIISIFKMYKYFKEIRPEIVHTHTPKAGLVGMIAAKLSGVPIRMHTISGLPLVETKGLKKKLLILCETITYSCATNVYANSFNILKLIKTLFPFSFKINVLGNGSTNGIDLKQFDPNHDTLKTKSEYRREFNIHDNDFVFLFVGRLVGDKGINELVKAFSKIDNSDNQFKLVLVGPYEQDLNPLHASTLKIIQSNNNIITTGYQSDVRMFYKLSDVFIFPSYREGFPNVIMEAGAMKLPIIASDINGCNEIITSHVNGLLVPPKCDKSLLKAMLWISSNHLLYYHLKNNSRKVIAEKYDQKNLWEIIINEYKNLSISQLKK
ncbi:glycosyltransferase family 4 protein [Flavobacterium sp. N1719]|uniref:glycosyltransferase family 4 protein n=1 Tax=Flavobacterium sp. N1719 TaxID=2885633 RepID=UPI002221CE13|nr:glycosyltransferase family 4 protein [Flavobacterium sp. N1719]